MELQRCAFLPILLAVSIPSFGAIRSVPDQYSSIQLAIDSSEEGDTVLVEPGVYEERIDFKGKNITVTSVDPNDLQVVTDTVIKGNGTESVVAFVAGEDDRAVLTGFTITGGYGSPDPDYDNSIVGAGIYCYRSSPTIRMNVIAGNNAPKGQDNIYGFGGGICCIEASPTMVCNTIRDNSAYKGAGIFVDMGEVRIAGNLIYGNVALEGGGARLGPGGGMTEFIGNTVVGNIASTVGGNILANGRCKIGGNIVANGVADHGGGIFWNGCGPLAAFPIICNDLWNNSGGDYWGVEDMTGRNGNISQDPLFQNPDQHDYHIQADSPCVNASGPASTFAHPDHDIDGEVRIWGTLADMGADEYMGYVGPVASAGPDQSKDEIPSTVSLDGSQSYCHPSGEPRQFQWRQVSGPAVNLEDATIVDPIFQPPVAGVYVFELAVTDTFDNTDTNTLRIAIGTDYLPVANAGLPMYTDGRSVQLDGSGSYDPDGSGALSYQWRQISGAPLTIDNADTSSPIISGFVQTDAIQKCEFELVVSDEAQTGLPSTVEIMVVPRFTGPTMRLENSSFDPDRPTVVYFGGGDCTIGYTEQPTLDSEAWHEKANVINFPDGYLPDDNPATGSTYFSYAHMLIAYLSQVAPHYSQPIQIMGFSAGGAPAIDVARYLNLTYEDPRYAVNRMVALDVGCRNYRYSGSQYRHSSVDGEQCWIDAYWRATREVNPANTISVKIPTDHRGVLYWYEDSISVPAANQFNSGVVGGAYWSVIGPGKNLQLATDSPGYSFYWSDDHMTLNNELEYPGQLPEPVTLGAWADISESSGSIDGVVLSCHESENAVGYQLLYGSDPHRVAHYQIISDTPIPPMTVIRDLPSEDTWWTIRVRDQYGSTIYADPIRLDPANLPPLSVENARTGKRYGLVGHAILEAEPGDTILLDPAVYEENITFGPTPLTVRSAEPNDPIVVSGTIIIGRDSEPAVSFSGSESAGCTLVGLTIQSATVGVSCRDATPTLLSCVVENPDGIAIEYWHGLPPDLIDCTVVGQTKEGGDPGLVAYWKLDESEGAIVHDNEDDSHATIVGTPGWRPDGGQIGGAMEFDGACFVVTTLKLNPSSGPFSVHAWVRRGGPGQVILSQQMSQNWLMADASAGALKTGLTDGGRLSRFLTSESVITDGDWHRIGFVWDGSNRRLYVDGVLVAEDTQDGLRESSTNLILGCGGSVTPGSFWTGLIDDVRIYDRAIQP